MPNPIQKYAYYVGSILTLLGGIQNPVNTVLTFLKVKPAGVQTIQLAKSRLQFKVRGTMDIWSVKETLLDRFYEKYGTPVQDGWNILDIGGGIGEFTIFAAAGQPAARVAAFEPFPESFQLLKKNLALNGLGHVQIFTDAIGAQNGQISLDISGGEPLMIQSGQQETLKSSNTISVNCITLENALDRLAFSTCHLLKLDCEGAEYQILMDAAPQVLERIQRIVMEYHDNPGQRTHKDLEVYLASQGFQVKSVPNVVHNHLGYLYAAKK